MLVLRPDEQLIWYDRPPAHREAMTPLFRAFFMTVWTVLALTVTFLALREFQSLEQNGLLFLILLAGAAFSVFGLVVWSWSVWQVFAAWGTFYGLTDKRLIVLKTLWPGHVLSLDARWIKSVQPVPKSNGVVLQSWGKVRGKPDKLLLFVSDASQLVADTIRDELLKGA